MSQLTALSPLDGRYLDKVKELSKIFSENSLMKYRLQIEVEYLIALSQEPKIKEVREFSSEEKADLRRFYEKFDEAEALKVKKIENTINHDVKAVEYYLKDKVRKIKKIEPCVEFVHFALTSEDVNNLSYSLMLSAGLTVFKKNITVLLAALKILALKNRRLAILSLTHGQPASPTTLGKELAVFYLRVKEQLESVSRLKLKGKFSGAVGNWSAQQLAYGNVDWPKFSQRFIASLGLEFNPLTTQIESHDTLAEAYHQLVRIGNIVMNLNQDIWFYISRGLFKQKRVLGEVGSSTMPHKVNPIDFENSEGNLGLAMALFNHLAGKLTISRLQRDLSDSTVLRNQGVALGYLLLGVKSTIRGLSRIEVDQSKAADELNNHWEILAEPVQIILRKEGFSQPYEVLKKLTRGQKVDRSVIHQFIRGLKIKKSVKGQLLKLTPSNYVGLAPKLVEQYLK